MGLKCSELEGPGNELRRLDLAGVRTNPNLLKVIRHLSPPEEERMSKIVSTYKISFYV